MVTLIIFFYPCATRTAEPENKSENSKFNGTENFTRSENQRKNSNKQKKVFGIFLIGNFLISYPSNVEASDGPGF